MSLSPQRKGKCLEIIDSLLKYKISSVFAYPVDPVLNGCPDYFTVIKNPMDILTVQNKLENNTYSKFSEFCTDVDLIWQNAQEYNGKDSIIGLLASQMKMWFHQKIFLMSDDETADWMTQLYDLQNQVSSLSQQRNSKSIQIENKNNQEEEKDSFEELKSGTFPTENKSKNRIISTSPKTSHTISTKNKSKNSKDGKNAKKPKKSKLSFNKYQRTISAAQLIELHRIITHIDDADKLLKILNVIKKNEPKLRVNENSNIDMNDLSMGTRVKLYDLIQKMNE